MQSLRGPLVWSHHLNQLCWGTQGFYGTHILPFYLNLPSDAIGTVCHQPGLLSTDLHLIRCAGFVETLRASNSCSSSARASMSLANSRLEIFLPPVLTLLPCCPGASDMIRLKKNIDEGGWQKTSMPYSDCSLEPFSHAAIHLNFTCSLFIELLSGAN